MGTEKLIVAMSESESRKLNRRARLAREEKVSTRIVLTSRDLEVLKFLLDMKFAPREELFERFFKITQSGDLATSSEFMRRRLIELEKIGFVIRIKTYHMRTQYILPTEKAQKHLQALYPDEYFPRALGKIDTNSFLHDLGVMRARREFEDKLGATNWISDHALRSLGPKLYGLTRGFTPDGVFQLPTGEWRAFELEIAKKDKNRYREKFGALSRAIDSRKHEPGMFQKVYVRCKSDVVRKMIEWETSWQADYFILESS